MRRFIHLLVVLLLTGFQNAQAQGTVRGKITDEKGEAVVGANVVLKSNPGYGTVSDFDGNYSLKLTTANEEVLIFRYISFRSQEVPVTVKDGQVIIKNITLVPESQQLGVVEIQGKASREKDAYMEKVKMNSATTIDYVSTETIKKTGDSYRYFRNLDDDVLDLQLSASFPIGNKPGLSRSVKFGGAYLNNDRDNRQYDYRVTLSPGVDPNIKNNDVNAFFAPSEFMLHEDSLGNVFANKYYIKDMNPANRIIGLREVIGVFGMVDYNISFAVRVTGGLRIEKAYIFTDAYEFDQLGYGYNDPRRKYEDALFLQNAGILNETSILPSAGIIFNILRDPEHPFNLRANYSKSVARPSIRELSETIVYDFEVKGYVFGDANLKPVDVSNYDLRLERFFRSGNSASLSVFYKDFNNHLELISTLQGYTWQNVDNSYVYGLELEGGIIVLSNLNLQANLTLVKSETEYVEKLVTIVDGVKDYIPQDTVKRTMFGQAPYVVNAIAEYRFDSLGLALSASYNIQGERLVITSSTVNPDIYEMPRNILDFKVSKSLGKFFNVSLKVQNILNEPVRRAYLFDDGRTEDYEVFSVGSTYTLGLTYKLSK